ncbi:lipoprotein [Streptomyces zinciresistens K42]|uniref:Lipoprotein n=1 Tax=Streptomyces zinciresistens K42 TaxID=700597 RepID=G2GI04_9ACTN|nr:lipoprotein [Streptomyces zinciresistens K42]
MLAAALVLAVLALGGCDSGPDAKSRERSGSSVIVPGKPGEPNRVMPAKEAIEQRAENDSPNAADVSYAQMMIMHHGQALRMTELAPDRAGSAKVKKLAARIAAAQGPEIDAMKGWLRSQGKSAAGGRAHASMPGMATEAQLRALRDARGAAFDRLFLKLMITHHGGAITMATDVKGRGNNIRVEEMADEAISQQSAEIRRMQDML